MIDEISESVKRRNRRRSIGISDNLIAEIRKVTKGNMTDSCFIRIAIMKEIERLKKDG